MPARPLFFSVIAAVLLAAATAILFVPVYSGAGSDQSDRALGRHSDAVETDFSPGSGAEQPVSGATNSGSGMLLAEDKILAEQFDLLLADLRSGIPPEEVLLKLRELKVLVHSSHPETAASAIIATLKSGEDCRTGLSYVVGAEGVMTETPTYRTALLDLLGQTDPFQSAEFARDLMSSTEASDEYSLALRNLAWANAQGELDGELRDRFVEMLQKEPWRVSPTAGYLEAFDVAVATGSVDELASAIEEASHTQTKSGELVGRAAFVSLDRIMLADASKIVAAFRRDSDLLSEAPRCRASIMSRLDVRQPEQASLLYEYLRRGDHKHGELEYFADLFPNGNYFSSHRLVTSWQSGLSMAELAELDRATIIQLSSWTADPDFSMKKQLLRSVIDRLASLSHPFSDTGP